MVQLTSQPSPELVVTVNPQSNHYSAPKEPVKVTGLIEKGNFYLRAFTNPLEITKCTDFLKIDPKVLP